MSDEYIVVAALHVRAGAEDAFTRFEQQALTILREHGGRLERAIRPAREPGAPFEIHLLAFESRSGFEAYRSDPRLAALASLRESAIERTTLWCGSDVGARYDSG